MQRNEMDRSGKIIIRICIFSIILSLTALVLSAFFNYWTNNKKVNVESSPFPTIVIDAGHGGIDGGAVAKDGTKEKDLNLSLAFVLSDMLKSSGFDVILTRENDEILTLENATGTRKMQDLNKRLSIVNETDDCILVSLHMNKFTQEKYSGVQVFYSPNNGSSLALADLIQKNVKTYIQNNNERTTKKAGSNIYLLDKTNAVAVLVECGFLSNPNECELLKNEGYQRQLASVICMSVVEFFDQM